MSSRKSLKNIRLVVYDFDGVMTDNKVLLREDGTESVVVNRSDGLAVSYLKKAGLPQVIITTEKNPVVRARARKLGIPVMRGAEDKKSVMLSYCRRHGIRPEEVAYIGNDLNDLSAMQCVGFPLCPADACPEVRRVSLIVLKARGGEGVVREFFGLLSGQKRSSNGNAR